MVSYISNEPHNEVTGWLMRIGSFDYKQHGGIYGQEIFHMAHD